MAETLDVEAVLEPRGPAGALILSDEQVERLGGGRKTFPVRVTVNGHSFEGRLASMRGERMIGFNKAVRAECGVEIGEEIAARIELDDAPRQVEMPAELTAALEADPSARSKFEAMAYSHRKEHARAIADAKKPETRERRIAKLLDALRD